MQKTPPAPDSPERLYHFVLGPPPTRWPHCPPSLTSEGFIHLCDAPRLDEVRERFMANKAISVLALDVDRLSDVRWEDTLGHGAFPHLYGPLPEDAVLQCYHVDATDTVRAVQRRMEQ